jgi:peptidoglycan-N-acetylglucosamine deacetylase
MFYHVRIKKKILYGLLLVIILLILAYLLNDQILQNVFQTSTDDVIFCVDTREKIISLTFEVSTGEEYVEEILDILGRHGIRATFFIIGRWINEYPELTQKIAAKHEVGSHSYSHPHLPELSTKEVVVEFEKFRESLENTLGEGAEIPYYRPPFGELDERAVSLALEEGSAVVLWSIESKDWIATSLEDYIDEVMQKVHPGAIMVFRTSSKETVMTLPLLIQSIWQQGYRIVSLEAALTEHREGL